MAGVECVRVRRVVILAVKLIDKKIKRIKNIVALGGHQMMMIQTTTKIKTPRRDGGKKGHEAQPAGSVGGCAISSFWGQSSWKEVKNKIKK